MDREMMKALQADGEKLRQLTGDDHGPFEVPTVLDEQMREARHDVASAAAAIAMVNAHIARALAWPAEPDNIASQKSSLRSAMTALRAAEDDLQSALVRLGIATE